MIPYILHVTVITTVCFLFYKLLLQKETFYRLNRWTLLSCLAVSFVLPFLPVPREWSWRDKWTVAEGTAVAPQHVEEGILPSSTVVRQAGVLPPSTADRQAEVLPPGIFPAATANQAPSKRHMQGQGAAMGNGKAVVREKTTRGVTEAGLGGALRGTADGGDAGCKDQAGYKGDAGNTVNGGKTGDAGYAANTGNTTSASNAANTGNTASPCNTVNAGYKSSKTTTGTPAEKKDAGTLARFFSGATLLLAVQWLFYVYLFGVMLFGANFLLQLGVLLYRSYSRPVIKDGRFRIVEISGNRAPCSFGNTIFINPEKYDWETYNQILIHEKIHVSGRHTLDILLAEIALVIQWFNPFAWLYRREVENNLEFLTDASVLLDAGIERSVYQLSLLRVSAPHLSFSLTNNYNQSLLKRRIVMMNSQSSSQHTVWKYFFLIPLLTGLMCALNKPAIALGAATTKLSMANASLSDLTAPVVDTTKKPAKPGNSATAADPKRTKTASSGESPDPETGAIEVPGNSKTYRSAPNDGYGTSMTITADNAANPQAIAAMIDAQDQALKYAGKTGYKYKNLPMAFAPMTDPIMINAKVNASIDAHTLGKVFIPDMPRFGFADDTVLTDGAWYATSYGDHLSFELKAGDDDHHWEYTLHVDKSEINPFPGQGNVSFKLVREAGTVEFKGQFDGQEGFGHFHFIPDAAYFPALKQLGVEDIEDRRQFGFFAMNIKKDYVAMLVHNGYAHISQRDLLSLAAMHIDEAYVQYWRGVNLGEGGADGDAMDPRTLIRLKALRIDRAYVDDLKAAGYDHLSLRELESLKAQRIDKAYILSMGRPNNQQIPVRELVSYKAMHIDSAFLEGLRKLGYDDLAMRDITSLYALHVTPEYIGQLQALGYKDLGARDLCNLKATHVTPEYIKSLRDIGYTDLNAREISSLHAMGITPEFVAGFQKLGFDPIPVRTLIQLKATGVTPEYVGKMRSQGFDSKDLIKYMRLKADFN